MIKTILFVISIIAMLGLIAWGIVKIVNYVNKHSDYDLNASIRQIENDYRRNLNSVRNSNLPDAEKNRRITDLENQMKSDIRDVKSQYRKHTKGISTLVVCALALASIGFVITIPGSFHQVEAGTYAVVKEVGKIVEVRTPGTYFDFYMIREYQTYDATVQQVKINTSAYSKDGQTMDLEVYLQYQIQLDKLIIRDTNGVIIQTEGIAGKYVTLDSLQSRIETQCIEKTKAVMSSAEAMTIIKNRQDYSEQVSTTVRDAIGPDYYVNVQDVVLTNIDFTDEFEKAIEDKVTAEQEAEAARIRAEGEKAAAIIKAEEELEVAKKEAEAAIERARGDAESQIIIAEAAARAAASKLIELARSLGFPIDTTYTYNGDGEVIATQYTITYDAEHTKEDLDKLVISYLEYLAYLEQWDGKLPEIVSGTDALSILVPKN